MASVECCCSCSAYFNIDNGDGEPLSIDDELLINRFANAHAKSCGYMVEVGAPEDPAWRTHSVGGPTEG